MVLPPATFKGKCDSSVAIVVFELLLAAALNREADGWQDGWDGLVF